MNTCSDRPARSPKEREVGLRDGRTLALSVPRPAIKRSLQLYDVVFVSVIEGKKNARAELREAPLYLASRRGETSTAVQKFLALVKRPAHNA